jgi:hypothetical protein
MSCRNGGGRNSRLQACEIVSLADWSDADLTRLMAHGPERA